MTESAAFAFSVSGLDLRKIVRTNKHRNGSLVRLGR